MNVNMEVMSDSWRNKGAGVTQLKISRSYSRDNDVTLYLGDTLELLKQIPDGEAPLIVTSPPYNLGKEYERQLDIDEYLRQQERVIGECTRILSPHGSICWETGNYVERGEIYPLDILLYSIFKKFKLKLRNRVVWHFEHGLHNQRRLSGRYETILWFTKTDDYYFNLDNIRIPQKYPGKKYYKGPKKGQYSSNPLGKNPGDVWIIPNVKHNHPEKTIHPCQYPIELVERLVLSMTREGDLVFDPFIGVGSTAVAAVIHKRRAAGADISKRYIDIAKERIQLAWEGKLFLRPMGKPIYEPPSRSKLTINPFI